jgi:predicted nucleotidyltransferase
MSADGKSADSEQIDVRSIPADATARTLLAERIPGLMALYRFGSSVDGTLRPDSDLDYAVLTPQPLDPVQRFDVQEELARRVRLSVDLVDLRNASTVMRMQVVSRGIRVDVLDPAGTDAFEIAVYSSYARLNEERREILADIVRHGTVHGR